MNKIFLLLSLCLTCTVLADPVYTRLEVTAAAGSDSVINCYLSLRWEGEEIGTLPFGVQSGETVAFDYSWNSAAADSAVLYAAKTATKVGQSFVGAGTGEYYEVGRVAFQYAEANRPTCKFLVYGSQVLPDGQKTVWAGTDTTLTAELYREGVDKLIAATAGGTAGLGAAAGGGGGGTQSELLATATIQANQLTDFTDMTPSVSLSGMQYAGATAGGELAALIPVPPSATPFEVPVGVAPLLAVTMPESFGGGTFDLNPWQAGRFADISSWFRTAVGWLALVLLGVDLWRQLGEWMRGFSSIQQARGNAIVGGTGAQATSLVAAGLITAVCVVLVTGLVGFAVDGVSMIGHLDLAAAGPFIAIPAAVFWMLDQMFPVALLCTALLARLYFPMYGAGLYATAMSVVRFVVP